MRCGLFCEKWAQQSLPVFKRMAAYDASAKMKRKLILWSILQLAGGIQGGSVNQFVLNIILANYCALEWSVEVHNISVNWIQTWTKMQIFVQKLQQFDNKLKYIQKQNLTIEKKDIFHDSRAYSVSVRNITIVSLKMETWHACKIEPKFYGISLRWAVLEKVILLDFRYMCNKEESSYGHEICRNNR